MRKTALALLCIWGIGSMAATVSHVSAPDDGKMDFKDHPSQFYLWNVEDMRDVIVALETTRAQYEAALSARRSYAEILEHQKRLMAEQAISREELEHSRFDFEYAAAKERSDAALIEALEARYEQKAYQNKVWTKAVKFDLETYYALFSREWKAQCEAGREAVTAAEALVRLTQFCYEIARKLHRSAAGSYYDLETKTRELVAARADLRAKMTLDTKCPEGLPSIQQLKDLEAHRGN